MFLQNKWWAVAESSSIRNKPISLRRLGEELVLWRDLDGHIVCQSSQCPHRGASLALGRVVDGYIECPYHGFRFANSGQCTLMPCEGKDAHISPAMRVKIYKVQEVHDLVWLWWGEDQIDYPPIPWFGTLPDSPIRWASGTMEWNVPFTRAAENLLIDVHHVPTLHWRILGGKLAKLTVLNPFDARLEGDIIHTWGQLRADPSVAAPKDVISFKHWVYFPSLALFDFGILWSRFIVIATPIDTDNTWAYLRYYSELGPPRLSQMVSKLSVWVDINLAQTDDYKIVLSSQPRESGISVNKFVHADQGIVLWHKLYESQMNEQ